MFKRGGKNGKWYAWNPVTHRRETTGCTDKEAARLVVAEWERHAADPTYFDAASKTLAHGAELLIVFLKQKDTEDPTLKMYDQKIAQLGRLFGDQTPLQSIMHSDRIDWYISTREAEGVTPSTIHKELVALRQILKQAKRKKWVRGELDEVMPVGYSPKYVARKTFLPVEQWPTLLDGSVTYTPKSRPRDKQPRKPLVRRLPLHRAAHVAFALATGANANECRRARRSHIDLEAGYVFVDGTKRETRKRYVPITPISKPLLERVLRDAPGKDYLFATWGSMWRDLREWCAALGLPMLTSNDLRRSFGASLARAGVRFEVIAKLMGHKGTKMVMEVYGQMRPEDLADDVRRHVTEAPAGWDVGGTRNTNQGASSARNKKAKR